MEAAATEPGADVRELAARYGVTKASLQRHIDSHPRAAVPAATTAPPAKKRGGGRRATSPAAAPSPRNALVTLVPPAPSCCSADRPHVVRRGDPLPQVTDGVAHHIEQLGNEDEGPATSRSSELIVGGARRSARERLEAVLDKIEDLLEEIDGDEEVSGAAKLTVLRALVSPIRLLGHFTGEVGASETTVAASPFYRRVRTAIVEALRAPEHSAALDAVITALQQLEQGGTADRSEAAE